MKEIKKLLFILIILFAIFTTAAYAQEQVDIYIFYGQGCPHCSRLLSFMKGVQNKYPTINIIENEVYFDSSGRALFEQMTAALIGRLTHHCHLMLFPGENNRLKESSINELYRSIKKDGDE